jgi:hypothetical protein
MSSSNAGRPGRPEQGGTLAVRSRPRNSARRRLRWAKAQGIDVKDRGRVPAELVVKFKAATGQ